MTTALIADDDPQLVRALQTQLATAWPDLEVMATARNGVEALSSSASTSPIWPSWTSRCPG